MAGVSGRNCRVNQTQNARSEGKHRATRERPLPGDPGRIGGAKTERNKPGSMNEFLKTRFTLRFHPSVLNGNCFSHLAAEERSFDSGGGRQREGGGKKKVSIFSERIMMDTTSCSSLIVIHAYVYYATGSLRYRAHRNKSNNVNNERSDGDARQSGLCVAVYKIRTNKKPSCNTNDNHAQVNQHAIKSSHFR